MTGNIDALSKLLASYGKQLEWAYFWVFAERHLEYVTRACTNGRFHMELPSPAKGALLPALNILAHQLENISVSYLKDGDAAYMNQLTAAWNRCVNLRKLRLWNSRVEDTEAIMAVPKANLRVLSIFLRTRISSDDRKKDEKKVKDICRKGCVNVENISIR